jgi:hypothetical protein
VAEIEIIEKAKLVSIPGGFSCTLRRRVKNGSFTLKSFLKARNLTPKKWTFGVPGLYKDP